MPIAAAGNPRLLQGRLWVEQQQCGGEVAQRLLPSHHVPPHEARTRLRPMLQLDRLLLPAVQVINQSNNITNIVTVSEVGGLKACA